MSTRSTFRARIVLRPRTLDEVFDLALAYGRQHFGALKSVFALTVIVPVLVFGAVAGVASGFDTVPLERALVLATLVAVLVSSWLERVVTVFVGRHLFETPVTLREAMGGALDASHLLFGTALRWSPLIPFALFDENAIEDAASLLLLLVLAAMVGTVVLVRGFFEGEVRLLERLKGAAARRRTLDLSLERHSRNLAFMIPALVFRILFVASALGASHAVFSFILQFEGVSAVLGAPAAVLGFAMSGPFVALARLFDYVDARTRGEGWDIQVRFQGIALRSEEATL